MGDGGRHPRPGGPGPRAPARREDLRGDLRLRLHGRRVPHGRPAAGARGGRPEHGGRPASCGMEPAAIGYINAHGTATPSTTSTKPRPSRGSSGSTAAGWPSPPRNR
jgi:hypothetical protein